MLETVIGLEIHVQLNTESKAFCSCPNTESQTPNLHICPICMGHPGTLPVFNREALRQALRVGVALQAKLSDVLEFDRKHYFYPDLPKGYQITQKRHPLITGGSLCVGPDLTVTFTEMHVEEDAAKSFHKDGATFIDHNRAGTPLLEIVTDPCLRSPEDAKRFLQDLRLLLRRLGVSDADMEKGQLRCDANISLREKGSTDLHAKTEIKNLNSFRHVEQALIYEIERQTTLWEAGTPPTTSTTRGWDAESATTQDQRSKEVGNDYRHLPEMDLPPVHIASFIDLARTTAALPTPHEERERYRLEYGCSVNEARQLVEDADLAAFIEATSSEIGSAINGEPVFDALSEAERAEKHHTFNRLLLNLTLSRLRGLLNARSENFSNTSITPENMAELIVESQVHHLSTIDTQQVLEKMVYEKIDPTDEILKKAEENKLNTFDLEIAITDLFQSHPDEVARYQAGKKELLQFFVGQIMKASKGKAAPDTTRSRMEERLNNA